ncbi:MAG: 5-oxoprolinase subunit PxpB, partial [Treponema sp.]|nr:5-oxoprolinase subunit PxpB [Treponema sp.]
MKDVSIVVSSEDSIQIQFPQKICEEVNSQIRTFVEVLKEYTSDIPQIIEIVPTYCAVTVYFNSDEIKVSCVIDIAEEVLEKTEVNEKVDSAGGKLVEIPVCYEDKEFAPDLPDVAKHTGLSKKEVIELHHSKDYLIYMLGFLPGFPYLGGMDERLETPRLETPRTKIPAGSVAIGGKQAGLYPSDSPGGWRIIGRTPLKVFDQNRSPACLYEAGDRIRFVPITRAEFDEIAAKENNNNGSCSTSDSAHQKYVCSSGIKIIEGGMCTTVQDMGRLGFQHAGIGQ